MAIQKTGHLTLSWSPIIGSETYDVHVYENNQFSFSQTQASTSIQVSGLGEGDSVYASVYSLSGFLRSLSGVNTASQSIPVANFHNSGKTFEFNSFVLDGINLDFVSEGHGYYATGSYQNKNSLLEFGITNPRDELTLATIPEEPFLSGLTYQTYNSEALNYNSGSLYSFSTSIPNNTSTRNYNTKIEVTDHYGSGITGFIDLNNEPISIHLAKISSRAFNTESGSFSITPTYSSVPTGLEFIVSRDEAFTDLIISGISSSTYNVTGSIPTLTSGFVSLTPYDWFGSGHTFTASDSIFIINTGFENVDSISEFQISQNSDNSNILLNFDATTGNPSGHYFTFSIDSSPVDSFNSTNSYETGFLYPNLGSINSGHLFNYFDSRTGTHDIFYGTLNLYQSGSNILADTATDSIFIPYPKFVTSGVYFDYLRGITELSFSSEPSYLFSGIEILVSGQDSPAFSLYSGDSFNTGSLYPNADLRLVKSSDNSVVYDTLNISGSGELPAIRTRPIDFISIEGTINTTLLQDGDVPIEFVKVHRKPAFKIINDERSGVLPQAFSGILNFNDFTGGQSLESGFSGGRFNPDFSGSGFSGGYQYEDTMMGHYLDRPPAGVSRNIEYTKTGVGFTGYYESGRHYLYRFIPYNGYGSGHITPAEVFEFEINEIAQSTESTTVTNTENTESNTTNINVIQNQYVVFSGDKEFRGNVELDPTSGCLALNVKRNVKISGWSGDSSNYCGHALDVAGNTIISGYQGNDLSESCFGSGSGNALTVLGHSKFSGDATVGTGENIVFEVLSDRSTFYHDLYVSGGNLTVSGTSYLGGIVYLEAAQAWMKVKSTGAYNPAVAFYNSSASNPYHSSNLGAAVGYDLSSDTAFFGHRGSSHLNINSYGNVGIGTGTPSVKLEVAGTISGTSAVFGGLSPILWTGVPITKTSNGIPGYAAYNSSHLYICTGENKWGRINLTGWS
jgi:hypothetical protein